MLRIALLLVIPAIARAEPQHVAVGDRKLTVGFGDSLDADKLDGLTLTLDRGAKRVWQLVGWKAIAGGKPMPSTLIPCQRYTVDIEPQQLGKRAGARIDIACKNGEDMFTANGVAILVDTFEPYAVLWAGDGDQLTDENGACVSEHRVKFVLDGGKLVQNIVDTTRKNADGSCSPGGKPGKPHVKTSRIVVTL
jgi:hypothetical protein